MDLKRGVQSIETGLRLVGVLAESDKSLTLKALAAAAGMPPSKAHRYLVSFIRAGLVEQDPESGLYDLGALTLTAGLTKLSRLDSYRVALEHLAGLHQEIEEAVLLAAWNGYSVVTIRWMEAQRPVSVAVRLGSLMPLINSATGRVFAAFLPEAVVQTAVQRDLDLGVLPTIRGERVSRGRWFEEIEHVRRTGIARVESDLTLGVDALSAPIFDHQGQILYAFSSLGPAATFNADPQGPLSQALCKWADACTRAMGGRSPWGTVTELPIR
jgi:DNA-binding IclR family transcriptional regulator